MKFKINASGFLIVCLLCHFLCSAQVTLPKLISDGMVLQHSEKIKFWGWAAPNEKVSLSLGSKNYTASANAKGEWMIQLPPQKAGGPHTLAFNASNKVVVNNVMFGDVWLCSGQSNMELTMARLMDTYPEETTATNPNIRQFLVPDVAVFKSEQTDLSDGKWIAVSPESIANFSGVAYFFAKQVYKKTGVPIGLINAALGGSPAQAWISEKGLKKFPEYYNELQKFKDDKLIASIEEENKQINSTWYGDLNKNDQGLKNGWRNADFNDNDWDTMQIPGYWADSPIGRVNGAVWFRKEIVLPQNMANMPARLIMGRIVDADSIFVNGTFVGTTSYQYPPRKYNLKANVLKPGKNTIAIRVISNSGRGGFVLDKEYHLVAGKDTISLEGDWKYKTGVVQSPAKSQVSVRMKPGGLYNAMIAPLQNYTVKGALWYQGESNSGKPNEYFDLMKTLIADWRAGWGFDMPFLYVQLPGFMEEKTEPGNSNWAILRDQQDKLLSLKNTAMAVALDLGEWNDIHPLNKKEVGNRLALLADKMVYGNKNTVATGPYVDKITKKDNKLVITFTNTGSGLTVKNDTILHYFAIADKDEKYVWATATINDKNQVVVWSDSVKDPVYVSYAWADNPATANLYNKEGLPAAPFKRKAE